MNLTFSTYAMSVTIADGIMPDGKSLEKVGVTPDEVVIPSGADMASHRDPVLARASQLLGVPMDAKKAGAIYPTDRTTEVKIEDQDDEPAK